MWNRITGQTELTEAKNRLEKEISQAKDHEYHLQRELEEEKTKALNEMQIRQQRDLELLNVRTDRELELQALEAKHRTETRELEEDYNGKFEELNQQLNQQHQTHQDKIQEIEDRMKNIEAEKEALLAEKKEVEERMLSKPWRNFEKDGDWTREYHDQLVRNINKQELHPRVKNVRFLIVGPIHAGKSSFINAVASVDKERIATPCQCGEAIKSLSKKLKPYKCKNNLKRIVLLDTMGVEEKENEGFNFHDLIYLIDGNVKHDYQFNPRCPIDKTHCHFKENPTLADKAHCVVIVMASTFIHSNSITKETKEKIHILEDHIREHDVPVVIVLTKIDQICEEVYDDITKVYVSRAVMSVVQKAGTLLGVPEMNIFPVRCYSKEPEYDVRQNILFLLAIKKMKEIASDSLESPETSEDDISDDNSEKCAE